MYKMYTIHGKIVMMKMKNNKYIKVVLLVIVTLAILLYSLTGSINKVTYDVDYYKEYSIENDVKSDAGISQDKLEETYNSLITYIDKGDTSLIEPYFNDKEVSHMVDVHKLFNLNDTIYIGSVFILIAFALFIIWQILKKNIDSIQQIKNINFILKSILIIAGIVIVVVFIMSFDFNRAFIKFHQLFFTNDLWILDPTTDLMIRMLPQDYFMSLAIRIFFNFVLNLGLILIILQGLKSYFERRKDVTIYRG